MHIPNKFKQDDLDKLKEIIVEYPFATLVSYCESGLEANHLPFVLKECDGKVLLQGHIAKVNDLWKNLENEAEVLVVFNGPNCYVSPNYYPTKKQHGKAVPTWNYVTVHAKGALSFIYDDAWNLQMINALTDQHEASQIMPWSTVDAPANYIQKMLPAVVGLQIDVSSITGQWKLSQNQPEQNQKGVVEGLSKDARGDSQKIAALVGEYTLNKE